MGAADGMEQASRIKTSNIAEAFFCQVVGGVLGGAQGAIIGGPLAVGAATIFQDMEKRKKPLNSEEVNLFFRNLEKGYCVNDGFSCIDSMSVFGYNTPKNSICEYDENTKAIGTHVLKFYVAEFDPALACQNIEKIKVVARSSFDYSEE